MEAKLILDAGDWAKWNSEESSELFVIILFFSFTSLGAGGPKSEKWFVSWILRSDDNCCFILNSLEFGNDLFGDTASLLGVCNLV